MADFYPFNVSFTAFVDEFVKGRKFPLVIISLISFCIYDETPPDGLKASNGHFIKRKCMTASKKQVCVYLSYLDCSSPD
jgi:hypothetical protein